MSLRNPDRLAFWASPPAICLTAYRAGGPVMNCFFFHCHGCSFYPRLKKSFDSTDMERGRCLLPIPGGWRSHEVPGALELCKT